MTLTNDVREAEKMADELFTKFQKLKGEIENSNETEWRKPDRKRQNHWKKERRIQRKSRHELVFEI